MIKGLTVALSSALIFTLSGCGGDSTPTQDDSQQTEQGDKAVNQAPIATFESFSINKGARYDGELKAIDPDGDKLQYLIVDEPQHGTVVLHDNGCFTYTPDDGYQGSDTFSYRASDDVSSCAVKTVTVDVCKPTLEIPQAPTNLTIKALSTTKLELTWSDNADNEEGFTIYKDGKLVATTHANETKKVLCCGLKAGTTYNFEVKAKNKAGTSTSATAQGTTKDVTTSPLAPTDLNAVAIEKTTLRLKWTDTADNESGYKVYQDGILLKTISSGCSCTVIKDLQEGREYDFKVEAVNKIGSSSSETIKVTTKTEVITPTNQAPTALPQTITMDEDTSKTIILTANDADGDTLTYTVVTPPKHGTYSSGIYTPTANYNGSDSFTFKANDGKLDSAIATISIVINDVAEPNTPPTATAQTITMLEDTKRTITLGGSDADGDSLTYAVVTPPVHGTFTNGVYTPTANYNGTDSFTFKANDGKADSSPATVSITITDVPEPNTAPTANSQSVTLDEDTTKTITLSGSDADGDSLTYTVITQPSHGTYATGIYTPIANYNGTDSFTFKVNDGKANSAPATVSITIKAINDKPTVTAQSVTMDEDTTKTITLSGSDIDGDSLTYTVVTQPTHGTYSNGVYTPTANYNGTDSFTFKANDGKVDSAPATVSITITDVPEPNHAPTANSQTVTLNEDTSKAITLSGSDIDRDTLTYTVVTPPKHGVLSGTAPSLTYTPTVNYSGSDSFTFKVNDGKVYSNIEKIHIGINKNINISTTSKVDSTRIGHYQTNSAVDVVVSNDEKVAFVADRFEGMVILDINNPFNPKKISSYIIEDDEIKGIAISPDNTKAYIATINSGLLIVDISDLKNPKKISSISKFIQNITVSTDGNIVYMTHAYSDTVIDFVDVSNPKSPTIINRYAVSMKSDVNRIKISSDETKLYVTTGLEEFIILDINDKTNPIELGSYKLVKGRLVDLAISSDETIAYIVDRKKFILLDISNPSNIIKISESAITESISVSHSIALSPDETLAYINNGYKAALEKFDISNSLNPIKITQYASGGGKNIVISADGTRAYTPIDDQGFIITDLSNTIERHSVDLNSSGRLTKMIFSKDRKKIFAADQTGGFMAIDTSSPFSPKIISSFKTGGIAYDIAISTDENRAYIANYENGFLILDISNLSNIKILHNFDIQEYWYFKGVALSNDNTKLYVTVSQRGQHKPGLLIFDISNNGLKEIGSYETINSGAQSIILSKDGTKAYITDDYYSSLEIVDISDPANPVKLGSYSGTGFSQKIVLSQDETKAYISNGATDLLILDISNPTNPKELSIYGASIEGGWREGWSEDIYLSSNGKKVYISDTEHGLKIIDVSKPINPKEISSYNTNGDLTAIALTENESYVYTGIYPNILEIIDLSIGRRYFPKNFGESYLELEINSNKNTNINVNVKTDRSDIISIGNYPTSFNYNDNNKSIKIPINSINDTTGQTVVTVTLTSGSVTTKHKIYVILR